MFSKAKFPALASKVSTNVQHCLKLSLRFSASPAFCSELNLPLNFPHTVSLFTQANPINPPIYPYFAGTSVLFQRFKRQQKSLTHFSKRRVPAPRNKITCFNLSLSLDSEGLVALTAYYLQILSQEFPSTGGVPQNWATVGRLCEPLNRSQTAKQIPIHLKTAPIPTNFSALLPITASPHVLGVGKIFVGFASPFLLIAPLTHCIVSKSVALNISGI